MLAKLPLGNYTASKQLISGNHINYLSQLLTGSANNLTALANGGQSAATPAFSNAFNTVATVANANDSYCLPPAKSGLRICVTNSSANPMQIFGAFGLTDKINATIGATGVSLAAGATALFICSNDGQWYRFVSS